MSRIGFQMCPSITDVTMPFTQKWIESKDFQSTEQQEESTYFPVFHQQSFCHCKGTESIFIGPHLISGTQLDNSRQHLVNHCEKQHGGLGGIGFWLFLCSILCTVCQYDPVNHKDTSSNQTFPLFRYSLFLYIGSYNYQIFSVRPWFVLAQNGK